MEFTVKWGRQNKPEIKNLKIRNTLSEEIEKNSVIEKNRWEGSWLEGRKVAH